MERGVHTVVAANAMVHNARRDILCLIEEWQRQPTL
jgi:hypothetical protein